jgi:hypothetical protein
MIEPRRPLKSSRRGPALLLIALVSVPALFFFSPLPAACAQLVIDSSELLIDGCEVREPTAGSAYVSCSARTRVPWTPLRIVSDESTASVSLRGGGGGLGSVLGNLSTPALDFGHGGSIALTIGGVMRVHNASAFRSFARDMYSAESTALELDAPLRLHIGGLITVVVRFRKAPVLRGARSFPSRVLSMHISEGAGTPLQLVRFPGLRPPNLVSIVVEVTNPSSFAMLPLGALAVSVQTAGGAVMAHMRTNASEALCLPHGRSVVRLSGSFAIADADLPFASAMLSDHLSGRPTLLMAVVTGVSVPLYNQTFGGMRLSSSLPGEKRPLLDHVRVVVDSSRLAAWANPLGPHLLVLDAFLEITNPLAASFAIMRIDADIFYSPGRAPAEKVGRMHVVLDASDPQYNLLGPAFSPILVGPHQAFTTPRPYPCIISGSLSTINAMLGSLNERGAVTVAVAANLSVGTGAIFPVIDYDQTNVTVLQWHAPPAPPAPPAAPFSLESLAVFNRFGWYRTTPRRGGALQ